MTNNNKDDGDRIGYKAFVHGVLSVNNWYCLLSSIFGILIFMSTYGDPIEYKRLPRQRVDYTIFTNLYDNYQWRKPLCKSSEPDS